VLSPDTDALPSFDRDRQAVPVAGEFVVQFTEAGHVVRHPPLDQSLPVRVNQAQLVLVASPLERLERVELGLQ
jgi:hypothetical protein